MAISYFSQNRLAQPDNNAITVKVLIYTLGVQVMCGFNKLGFFEKREMIKYELFSKKHQTEYILYGHYIHQPKTAKILDNHPIYT